MFEKPNLPETIREEDVVEALNTKGIDDQEAREMLEKYADQCHAEADAEVATDPESPETSNRANIKAEIKIAILYSKTEGYRNQARESLEDAHLAASQSESTQDLAVEIKSLIKSLEL